MTGGEAAPAPAENLALARALAAHQKARQAAGPSANGADLTPFERFLQTYPHSRWRVALLSALGTEYYQRAAFSKALAAWRAAWESGQKKTNPRAVATVNRALAGFARMEARVGEADRLEALLGSVGDRPMEAAAASIFNEAKECLWTMRHHPEISYKCGPWALDSILSATDPSQFQQRLKIMQTPSTDHGLSLSAVAALARELKMDLAPARRTGAAGAVPVPAVVHWKLNHYGALLRKEGDRYLLKDPTFGGNAQWVSQATLDDESSGYFLVPAQTLTASGWRAVPDAEGQAVWGKGPPVGNDPNGGPGAPTASGPGGGPAPGTPPKRPKCHPPGTPGGMAAYDIILQTASLTVSDSPLGYVPSLGPSVHFNLTYAQREANQPTNLYFANFGTRWNFDWITTLTFDSNNAYVACGWGGTEVFPNFTASTQTSGLTLEARTRLINAGNNVYQEILPEGSMKVFEIHDSSGRYYMTRFVDEQGNAVRLGYDDQYRLIAITDAMGQVTTFSYEFAADPLKITRITDPFNRTALFAYDSGARLSQITDAQGLTSQFAYFSGTDVIQTMTTGYGTTSFAPLVVGQNFTLMVTLPDGSKEMVQSVAGPAATPGSEAVVPKGMTVVNQYLEYRNTYYWDRKAMLEAPGDVTRARLYHFCHSDTLSKGLVIESEKAPLESKRYGWHLLTTLNY